MPNAFQCAFRQEDAFQDLCAVVSGCFVVTPGSGLTLRVPDGAVSLQVVVNLIEPYQVKASPNWATDVMVTLKTTSGFRLDFTVAAPPDGEVDLTIFQDMLGTQCQ